MIGSSIIGRELPSCGPTGLDWSNPEPDAETVLRGQRAWIRLREGSTWADWIAVGRAHVIGRAEALRVSHSRKPAGPRYQEAFAEWLKRFGFHTLDKGDRARLFVVMEHLTEIEKWRGTLSATEQLKLNHPTVMLRKWRKSCTPTTDAKRLSPVEKLKQQVDALIQENQRLTRDVETGGGDLWAATDRPADIARIMASKLTLHKLEQTAKEMLALVKKRRAEAPTETGGERA